MAEETTKKNRGRLPFILVLIVCIGVLAFSGYKIISIRMNYKQAQDEYTALREYTTVNDEPSDTDVPQTVSAEPKSDDSDSADPSTHGAQVGSKKHLKAPITVDHNALQAANPDYIGWLYIGALGVSYPVMRGTDDEYYLHHTFDGSYLFAGSLFVNYTSGRDFSDPHTLIYGHNMKDGSMFGTLRTLLDNKLYEQDPYFWILTPKGDYRYKMFAMYTCLDTSDTYTVFSGHGEIVADYIKAMKAKSLVDLGEISYDTESKVVTLSTCVQAEGSERFVVQGILDE